ncbi:hypothetical protein [Coralliovum pocilloporae]|uniref:hypothetical protein n=1 Tax=Coralliovum pocilloporae TaxID=3066369 RepID=UPI0033072B3A
MLALLGNKWTGFICFVIMMGLFAVINLITLPTLQAYAGGLEPFDLRYTGYKPDDARDLLAALAGEGVTYYRSVQLPLDFIFPVFFALGVGLPTWRVNQSDSQSRIMQTLRSIFIAAPIFTACADLWENWQIIQMLADGPNASTELIRSASRATTLKFGFGAISWLGLLFGVIQSRARRRVG